MKTLAHNRQFWLVASLIGADLLFFGLTNPANVPSFALIIGFLLFAATLYMLVQGFFKLGVWYGFAFSERQKRFARIVTGVIAGAVALQSMGQLSGRDLLVVVPFAVLIYMYLSYGKQARALIKVEEWPMP